MHPLLCLIAQQKAGIIWQYTFAFCLGTQQKNYVVSSWKSQGVHDFLLCFKYKTIRQLEMWCLAGCVNTSKRLSISFFAEKLADNYTFLKVNQRRTSYLLT
jgi:hypothetical protein